MDILKTLEEATQIYAGRNGCRCGCQGKYYHQDPEDKSWKRIKEKIAEDVVEGKVLDLIEDDNGEFLDLHLANNRVYTLFFKK